MRARVSGSGPAGAHQALERVREKIVDGRILELVERFLKAGVMEEQSGCVPPPWVHRRAASSVSPLLANVYLNALDWKLHFGGWELVRYADDFVVLCRTREHATEVLEQVRQWCESAGLRLHPEKTRLVDMSERGGFDFFGYHFVSARASTRYPAPSPWSAQSQSWLRPLALA